MKREDGRKLGFFPLIIIGIARKKKPLTLFLPETNMHSIGLIFAILNLNQDLREMPTCYKAKLSS